MDISEIPDPSEDMPELELPGKGKLALMAAGLVLCFALGIALFLFLRSTGAFLPSWVRWNRADISVDVDGDGSVDSLHLGAKHVEIAYAAGGSSATPEEWLVSDAAVGDIDGDGKAELVLLAWRRGSFLASAANDGIEELSLHLCVMRFAGDGLEEAWISPALPDELAHVSIDAAGRVLATDSAESEKVWVWDGSGLAAV